MISPPVCSICGEPMEEIESMFKFHGSIGPCPKPPLKKPDASPRELFIREWTDSQPDAFLSGKVRHTIEHDVFLEPHPDAVPFIERKAYDSIAKRVAELERIHDGCSSLAIRLDAAKAENIGNLQLIGALQDEIEFLKAQRVQFIKTRQESIEEQDTEVAQANARIKELEADNLLALGIADKFANERDEMKEREQKLVAALENLSETSRTVAEEIFTYENCEGLLANEFMGNIIEAEEALKAHTASAEKGGA